MCEDVARSMAERAVPKGSKVVASFLRVSYVEAVRRAKRRLEKRLEAARSFPRSMTTHLIGTSFGHCVRLELEHSHAAYALKLRCVDDQHVKKEGYRAAFTSIIQIISSLALPWKL